MLTHAGHKRLLELRRTGAELAGLDRWLERIGKAHCQEQDALARLFQLFGLDGIEEAPCQEPPSDAHVQELMSRGWVQHRPRGMTGAELRLVYSRNPLEHVSRINYEITTRCNFACVHCRNGGVEDRTDTNQESLAETGRVFLSLGIRRFDFIGGEVSKYGNGWLELVRQLRLMDAESAWPDPLAITLYTTGWWIGRGRLQAAGRRYGAEAEFLADLKASGVTHILFSIDGPESLHDTWRKHPGLFRRVLDGLPRVIAAGLKPRLSVVVRPTDMEGGMRHLKPFADVIYGPGKDSMDRLMSDPLNHFSNLIDVGRASEGRTGQYPISRMDKAMARCKAFFRPAPTLRIMANGEIGICPLMHGEEGYGNVHRQPVTDLLNRMHETPIFKAHADGRIGEYLARLDTSRFGDRFDHPCAVRIALNRMLLAEQGMYVGSLEKSFPQGFHGSLIVSH